MKSGKILWCLLFSVLMLSGCDDKKDEFSGLSEMVSDRNEVRRNISDENARKKVVGKQESKDAPEDDTLIDGLKKRGEISSVVLYERQIEVVDSSSHMALAKGIAYLNKEGQIVKIKIIKE
ncbi:MAG: hypothetical protein GY710_18320 [Desulfobacteraceae bacterium]|nr:hypothetical protein [Desulfobacteraceae bacterium]